MSYQKVFLAAIFRPSKYLFKLTKKGFINISTFIFFIAFSLDIFAALKDSFSVSIDSVYSNLYTDEITTKTNMYTNEFMEIPDSRFAKKSNSYGYGITYKYDFNINNFLISPGIFFENNQLKTKTVKINNRYGAKIDLGYNLFGNSKISLSPYLTAGYVKTRYDTVKNISTKLLHSDSAFVERKRSSKFEPLYGIGFKINCYNYYFIGVEYNHSILKNTDHVHHYDPLYPNWERYETSRYKTKLNIFKINFGWYFDLML